MEPPKCTKVYTSACANGQENNLICSKDHLIYSRTNAVLAVNLSKPAPAEILFKHQNRVNGLKFVAKSRQSDPRKCHLISTSYDKSAIIWQMSLDGNKEENKILYQFASQDSDFISRCSIQISNGDFISITTTLNNHVQLWQNDQLIHSFETTYCCLDSKLQVINLHEQFEDVLVFLAGSDNFLHIFQLEIPTGNYGEEQKPFRHLMDLGGHSDWVKCVESFALLNRKNEFLVATSSLDSFVNIFHLKIIDHEMKNPNHIRTYVSKSFTSSCSAASGKELALAATLETVLSGHEAAVNSLCWFDSQASPQNLQLITCSSDKSIIIWEAQLADSSKDSLDKREEAYDAMDTVSVGIWKEAYRFGETGETNLPFLSVVIQPQPAIYKGNQTFYALSLRGAIHSWTFTDSEDKKWSPGRTITGHYEPVTDLSWEADGLYLLSVSLDKTCRLHAIADCDQVKFWTELARPQVHGYEINCVANTSFGRFASGSDEMTIRIYGLTKFFMENFISLTSPSEEVLDKIRFANSAHLPKHAQLSALGLTIKGGECPYDVPENANEKNNLNNLIEGSPLIQQVAKMNHLNEVPIEEILLQSTLWWESDKLFGHGNELHALASNNKESLLASASKANRADLANILIWDSNYCRKLVAIEHHTLTITRLKFSPSHQFLLSVSRDRTWCLCKRNSLPRKPYVKVVGTNKGNAIHERIIWDCAWTWDDKFFITVSRDKKAVVWCLEDILKKFEDAPQSETEVPFKTSKVYETSIQAVDSVPYATSSYLAPNYLFALGFEDGTISLESISILESDCQWNRLKVFTDLHHSAIRRLAFKPVKSETTILATAADDCVVNLVEIEL